MAIRVRQSDHLRLRIERLFACIALFYVALVGRLVYLQAMRGEYYGGRAKLLRAQRIPQRAVRGDILDRNGQPLAVTIHAGQLVADPTQIEDANQTARALSALLGGPPESYLSRLQKRLLGPNRPSRREVVVARLEPASAEAIRKASRTREYRKALGGISVVELTERSYPAGRAAAHLTGFLVPDEKSQPHGAAGLERALDPALAGNDGYVLAEVDARGRIIADTIVEREPVFNGVDVRLTIDSAVQRMADSELAVCTEKYHPAGASVVILDPATGEILALVSHPSFDPAKRAELVKSQEPLRNRATSLYEPGSTLKVITAAIAMEEKTATPRSTFHCSGEFRLGNRTIKCAAHGGSRAHGALDLTGVIEKSCNVATAQIGVKLGMERLRTHLEQFGLLGHAGEGLPHDVAGYDLAGRLGFGADALDSSAPKAARVAFGQSVLVTPLGLASAYGALANGGELMKPRLVAGYIGHDGKSVREFGPQSIARVAAPENAARIVEMMRQVVTSGTGKAAAVPGYTVGGKTGTAQKVVPGIKGYASGKYVASFVGLVPAHQPRAVIAVVVDEPRGAYYGAQVAAPVFQRIAQRLMWHWKVPPDDPATLAKVTSAK